MKDKISVIGAGSWGTTLAKLLADKGNDVLLWAYEQEVAEAINNLHLNPLYLPDIGLPVGIRATTKPQEALAGREFVVSVVPSHVLRPTWLKFAPHLAGSAILVSCTKGIETTSLKLIHQIFDDCIPNHPKQKRVVLSGPSFAREVALGLPTSVVVAGSDAATLKHTQDVLHTDAFLVFTHSDVTGVEVGGAVKNVIAIATGISDGLELGNNARAAIITRGLYEMIKIGKVLGANPLTFAGLSGIGDLVLTCTSNLSRNHTVGVELGRGRDRNEVCRSMNMVAEGIHTAEAIYKLTKLHGIDTPICNAVYKTLFEGLAPRSAIDEVYAMPLKDELGAIMR